MESVKAIGTPTSLSYKLDKDKDGKSVNQKLYRGIIGSLLYLIVGRSDIMFNACIYIRFQSNAKESYMLAVKKILTYLMGTQNWDLWHSKHASINLIGYCDIDYWIKRI